MPRPSDPGDLRVFTRESLRELDRLARVEFGIPSIVLMENAARHVADIALDGLEGDENPGALVVCGPGNNGGDGLAAARHLHNAGLDASIILLTDHLTGDPAVNLEIARRMGLRITLADPDSATAVRRAWDGLRRPGVILDAIFGTGLARQVDGPAAALITGINALGQLGVPVLAVDCPSGMDANTGQTLGAAVHASVTVSFVGLKEGFLALGAQSILGEIVVADIGAPRELAQRLGRLLGPLPEKEPRAAEHEDSPDPPSSRGRRMD
ncbi:Bifunctional NAD(P)H-hydrate repair enzyme Nnr [Phycisphaerales bacterium]|nr:Bifunctional NAD(P)H-hydrate repair enzyme Nnr [Phycisphaerales bacterium]